MRKSWLLNGLLQEFPRIWSELSDPGEGAVWKCIWLSNLGGCAHFAAPMIIVKPDAGRVFIISARVHC